MWAFLTRRDDSPVTRALNLVVVLLIGFLAARVVGLDTGPAVTAAVGLATFDMLLAVARRQPPDEAPSSRDAT